MKKSKYVGKQFGNWQCSGIGLANVQGAKAKRPGKRNYYYLFERRTSDNQADKLLRLNSTEAASVYAGKQLPEEILNKRENSEPKGPRRITYHFGS